MNAVRSPAAAQTIASEVRALMTPAVSRAERIRGLQAQARALALEEVERLEAALRDVARMAEQIASGGDAYPVGARELSGRITTDLPARADTLKAIADRLH